MTREGLRESGPVGEVAEDVALEQERRGVGTGGAGLRTEPLRRLVLDRDRTAASAEARNTAMPARSSARPIRP